MPMWARFMKEATRGDEPRWLLPPRGFDDSRMTRVADAGEGSDEGAGTNDRRRGFWARLFRRGK